MKTIPLVGRIVIALAIVGLLICSGFAIVAPFLVSCSDLWYQATASGVLFFLLVFGVLGVRKVPGMSDESTSIALGMILIADAIWMIAIYVAYSFC